MKRSKQNSEDFYSKKISLDKTIDKLKQFVWIKEQTCIDRNVFLVSKDMKHTNYFASFFHFNYPSTRLNDLGQYMDIVLYVGRLQAGLGSVDRLQVIDWTPFVNQLDPFL